MSGARLSRFTSASQGETVGRPFAEIGHPNISKPCQWSFAGSFRDTFYTFWSRMKPSIFGLWGESPSPRKERERLDLEVVAATSDEPTWKNKDVQMLKCFRIDANINRCQMIDFNVKSSCSNLLESLAHNCWLLSHVCIQQKCVALCVLEGRLFGSDWLFASFGTQ